MNKKIYNIRIVLLFLRWILHLYFTHFTSFVNESHVGIMFTLSLKTHVCPQETSQWSSTEGDRMRHRDEIFICYCTLKKK